MPSAQLLERNLAQWLSGLGAKMRGPWSQSALDRALLESCALSTEEDSLNLFARGARPSQIGPTGSTCLMFAARRDQCELFIALCAHPLCDTRARDLRGRDALAWASSRKGFLGVRPASALFESLDDSLFDLDGLDAEGRHACQSALESEDEGACLFWLCRAPSRQVDLSFERMDVFAKACGAHGRACEWLARSQALALERAAPVRSTAFTEKSSPRL